MVIITVARKEASVSDSFPSPSTSRRFTVMTVVIAEAPRLTKLFPMSIVERAVAVKFSLILYAMAAVFSPASALFFRRSLFEVLNAISDPERRPTA